MASDRPIPNETDQVDAGEALLQGKLYGSSDVEAAAQSALIGGGPAAVTTGTPAEDQLDDGLNESAPLDDAIALATNLPEDGPGQTSGDGITSEGVVFSEAGPPIGDFAQSNASDGSGSIIRANGVTAAANAAEGAGALFEAGASELFDTPETETTVEDDPEEDVDTPEEDDPGNDDDDDTPGDDDPGDVTPPVEVPDTEPGTAPDDPTPPEDP